MNSRGNSDTPRSEIYDLFAIIAHSGMSTSSGHYWSYCRAPNGMFYEFNDDSVRLIPNQSDVFKDGRRVFMLFYIRREARVCPETSQVLLYKTLEARRKTVDDTGTFSEGDQSGLHISVTAVEVKESEAAKVEEPDKMSSGLENAGKRTRTAVARLRSGCRWLAKIHNLTWGYRRLRRTILFSLTHQRINDVPFACSVAASSPAIEEKVPLYNDAPPSEPPPTEADVLTISRRQEDRRNKRAPKMASDFDADRRVKQARSYKSQFGVASVDKWDSDGEQPPEISSSAFERMQQMLQPPQKRRDMHDRDYDRGKTKKIKNRSKECSYRQSHDAWSAFN